ncbi:NAD(P)H-dependent oxidoreductase [Lactobacillus sp. DCY120]|uniref:NAD(P)H-dependent oxidoreductase n=1 Tax=Bombilactobacillus apium TaxID=2675299 RepID=A0A850R1X1_9LACO|nr:NADPH-dependent FMN reductase [Bombilactobacillus apium]NVY96021.1 NAD(P)H-dependent oxidoreductase [Bombilactobacillus apium]
MKKFCAIVGSNAQHSTNRDLLTYMSKRYQNAAEIELLEIKEVPIFVKNAEMQLPEVIQAMKQRIAVCDGVIIGTPEYDHSIPAVLASTLAWLSYGIHPLLDKPVMITGASYGTLGASRAQAQLRQILDSPEIKARVMPSSEFLLGHSLAVFDEQGDLKNPDQIEHLDELFNDFLTFADLASQLNNAKAANQEEVSHFTWDSGLMQEDEE